MDTPIVCSRVRSRSQTSNFCLNYHVVGDSFKDSEVASGRVDLLLALYMATNCVCILLIFIVCFCTCASGQIECGSLIRRRGHNNFRASSYNYFSLFDGPVYQELCN